MHLEAFNGLVILDNWVERSFLQFLPIPAEVILGVWVEEEEKVFNI